MSDKVIINDKSYYTIRAATKEISYTSDYITRLAREQKIKAVQLGRRWYVHLESLQKYSEVQSNEQAIRQKHLRQQRLVERTEKKVFSSVSYRLPLSELTVVVAVLTIIATGVMVGFYFSTNTTVVAQTAGVAQATPAVTAAQKPEAVGMRAVFSESDEHVHIDQDRTMTHPSHTENWQYLHYE